MLVSPVLKAAYKPWLNALVFSLYAHVYLADRNIVDPRTDEEHHLTINGCDACARMREITV